MDNKIIAFTNPEFGEVRTLNIENEPWFVAADVCKALDIINSRDAVARLDDDEKNTVVLTDGIPGNPNKTIVNEPGLYTLVLGSRKPEAKAFKRWITHDVIPSIRKNGEYVTPKAQQKRLGEVNSAARIIRQTLKEAGMAPQFVAVAMKSLYEPVGVEIPLEGITLNKRLFDATTIAKQLGVLSRTGNPHAHAISAIIAQLDVQPNEKELAPFQNAASGHAGTCVQYTESVVEKVHQWLEIHDYPTCFECQGKTYTVRYSFN